MSGFVYNEGEQAQPKRLIPLEQELAESDEDIVQEIELSGKFFSKTEDTCTKLKKNPFQQRKLIKIGYEMRGFGIEFQCVFDASVGSSRILANPSES